MSSKDSRPNYEDYAVGATALTTYIELLEPDAVIIYSKEAWNFVQQGLSLFQISALVAEEVLPPPTSKFQFLLGFFVAWP